MPRGWSTRSPGRRTAARRVQRRRTAFPRGPAAGLFGDRRAEGDAPLCRPTCSTTYIGAEAGGLILEGQVRRGDVRTITAALMLVDLRDFSLMSDTMAPAAVIGMLNEYFDCVMPPVHDGTAARSWRSWATASWRSSTQTPGGGAGRGVPRPRSLQRREGVAALAERNRKSPDADRRCTAGVALHYGTVSYGNIGVRRTAGFHRDRPRRQPDQPDRAALPRA